MQSKVHYENLPMQFSEIAVKRKISSDKKKMIILTVLTVLFETFIRGIR